MSSLQQGNANLITSVAQTVMISFFVCLNIKVDLLYSKVTDSTLLICILYNHVNQSQLQLLFKLILLLLPVNLTARMLQWLSSLFLYSQPPHFPTWPINAFCHSSLPLKMNSPLCPFSFSSLNLHNCPNHIPLPQYFPPWQ